MHVRKILPEQLDGYIIIHHNIDIHNPTRSFVQIQHQDKSHNGYIFVRVTKGVYGIPQAVQISHDALFQHLEPYGYLPLIKPLVLYTHDNFPINFT